jgi:hypothetical protein
MRLLAYFHPSQNPHALRDDLMRMGWKQVAMRDGSLWRADSRPEEGWAAVCAFGYPGILRAYEGTGRTEIVHVGEIERFKLPPPPVEIEALPERSIYAVVNPGAHLLTEVEAFPIPAGAELIGINEAARRIPCNWQLCNDGFNIPSVQGALGEFGRITRRRFSTTIPSGRWFALDRIGIVDGTFSTTCALRCAVHGKAAEVWIYGHDMTVGSGLDKMCGHWEASQISNLRAEVEAQVAEMRKAGIRVVHIRMVDGKPYQDDGSAPAPAPAEPAAPTPKRKKGK